MVDLDLFAVVLSPAKDGEGDQRMTTRRLLTTLLAAVLVAGGLTLLPVPGAPPAQAATSLTGTTPTSASNGPTASAVRVVLHGAELPATPTATLAYTGQAGSGSTASLSIVGRTVSATATSVTVDFDLRGAAPQLYEPRLSSPDGTTLACSCRFQVLGGRLTATAIDADTSTTGSQRTVTPGTTKNALVVGEGLDRGSVVAVSGSGVTARDIRYVDGARLALVLDVASDARAGARDLTVTRTDGASARCAACLEVRTSAAPPSASPTRPATTSPTPTPTPIVELRGPAQVGRSEGTYVVEGRGRPRTSYSAVISVQGFAQRTELLTTAGDGALSFAVSAVADASYELLDETGRVVAAGATRSVGTTLVTPDGVVPAGRQVTLVGRARAGAQIDVWFRATGRTTFTDRRDLVAASDGRWTTVFTADRDYRYYASSQEGQSPWGLVQVGVVRVAGPAQVRRGAVAVLTGRVHPVRPVELWFRRSGSSDYVLRRTVVPGRDGSFRANFTPDVDHAYYARSSGIASARRITKVVQPVAAPAPALSRPGPAADPAPQPRAPRCHPSYRTCIPFKGNGSGSGEANDLDCDDPGVPRPVFLYDRNDDPYRLDSVGVGDGVGCEP